MTHLDDVELGRRLNALRVEPPHAADFEARLGERLLAPEQGKAPPAVGARVIVGPWLRRGPARLIGATALLLAGAAAAMEGGAVEWVRARVFQRVDDARPAPPAAEIAPADVRGARAPRLERAPVSEVAVTAPEHDIEAAPVPAVPLDVTPGSSPEPAQPLERRLGQPSQLGSEGTSRWGREALVRERPAASEAMRSPRASDAPIRVPRVAIERRWERSDSGERRFERRVPQLEPRDMQRPLEHLREVARQRRERSATERGSDPRTPSLERLRERRERIIERRDGSGERERRDGERRERGNR